MSSPTFAEARRAAATELRHDVRIMSGIVLLLWAVLFVNTVFYHGSWNVLGIMPRTRAGLRGLMLAPFLHAGVAHLASNTVGFVLLGGMVLLRRETDFRVVTAFGIVLGGLGTWLFGRSVVHIGASGVIFAYLGYLLFTGFFERRLGAILLSVAVAVGWGSLVFGVLPRQPGISWEGHLFGLIAGVCAAWVLAARRRVTPATR